MDVIQTQNPTETQNFFDFEFEVVGDKLMETRYNGQVLDPCIGASLFLVKGKYDEKNERLKKRTKIFNEKQKRYEEIMENTLAHNRRCKEHIQKAEAKLTEYKNTILAFGKLASCNSISK